MTVKRFFMGAVVAIGAASVMAVLPVITAPSGAVVAAQGEGGQGEGQRTGQSGGQQGQAGEGREAGAGQGRSGSALEDEVLRGRRGVFAADEDEDSDRPDWAGTPGREGKPGRGNETPGVPRGDIYGDLWLILRDDDGNPILDDNGYIQPCLDAACTETVQLTEDGELPEEYADQVIEPDFGRLNITRAPSMVIEHALTEALAKVDGMIVDASNLDAVTDESGRLVDLIDGSSIDSPLENLALYQALLEATAGDPDDGYYTVTVVAQDEGGADTTLTLSVAADVLPTLAASAIAAGADKTGDLNVDEVMYISGFLGVDDELSSLVATSTYDRDTTFDEEVTILVYDPDNGVYVPETVNLLQAVDFNTIPAIEDDGNGIDTFTQNADDALQVLEFVHDNALVAE